MNRNAHPAVACAAALLLLSLAPASVLAGPAQKVPGDGPGLDGVVRALQDAPGRSPGAAVAGALRAIALSEGIAVPSAGPCPPLMDAVRAHAARLGVPTPALPLGVALPPDLEDALGCLLDAVHGANLAHDATFTGVPLQDLLRFWDREEITAEPDLGSLLEGRDHRHNLVAAIHLAEAVDRALPVLQAAQARAPLPLSLDLRPILRLDASGDTYHEHNYALIVDLAGSDTYDNHAGGVFIAKSAPNSEFTDVMEGTEWMRVPLPDGTDAFIGGKTQDADNVVSAGLVVDLDGDDAFGVKHAPLLKDYEQGCGTEPRVPWVGTLGGGITGVGMLFALGAGDDVFTGRTATQGVGHVMGVGVLYAGPGQHRFEAVRLAQGSALLGGVGLLLSEGGDDTYAAQVPEGGVFNGDTRRCDDQSRYMQGSIFDRRDGTAPPMAGVLADLDGHDTYIAELKAQGFAQGYGPALLLDLAGDDTYEAEDIAQGAALGRPKENENALPTVACLALFLDLAGSDAYALTGAARGQGWASGEAVWDGPLPSPDLASVLEWAVERDEAVGVFLDALGSDAYHAGPPGREDGGLAGEGVVGVFVDAA